VGLIILLNAALTGVEVEQRLSGNPTLPFRQFEIVFTMIYVFELILRIVAGGFMKVNIPINVKREWGKRDEYPYSFLMPAALVNEWVLFDGFLVSVSIMALAAETFQNITGVTPTFLRLLRLLRLLRALRPFIQFRTLYILVRGLLNSMSVMLSTIVITTLLLYIGGLAILEFITLPALEGEFQEEFPEAAFALIATKYSRLWPTMLSILEIMLLDSPSEKYRIFIESQPKYALLFIPILVVTAIVLMNLVTAVFVDFSMISGKEERDSTRRKEALQRQVLLDEISYLFSRIDENQDGVVSFEEIMNAPSEIKDKISKAIGMGIIADEVDLDAFKEAIGTLFAILDVDGSKSLSVEEFVNGISRVISGTEEQDRHSLMHIEKLAIDIGHSLGLGYTSEQMKTRKYKIKEELIAKFDEIDGCVDGNLCWSDFKVFLERVRSSRSPGSPGSPGSKESPRRGSGESPESSGIKFCEAQPSSMEQSEKYEEIISLLERFVRPRAIESLDLEGVFQAIDVDGDGNVDTEEYFTGIMMLCENNAVNDRQLLLNLQKMLHCTVQHDMLDEQRWRMQQGTRRDGATERSVAEHQPKHSARTNAMPSTPNTGEKEGNGKGTSASQATSASLSEVVLDPHLPATSVTELNEAVAAQGMRLSYVEETVEGFSLELEGISRKLDALLAASGVDPPPAVPRAAVIVRPPRAPAAEVAGRSFPGFVAHCLESSTAGASSTVEDPGVFRNQREAASAL
jgi:Ca2+-binding EF-hand superfamily protein